MMKTFASCLLIDVVDSMVKLAGVVEENGM